MPGVADHQHRRARPDLVDERRHPRRLVLVEQADHPAGDPDLERLRQRPHPAGVLGGHDVGAAQRVDQPGGGVGGLAQRRGGQQQSAGGHAAQPTIVADDRPATELRRRQRARYP